MKILFIHKDTVVKPLGIMYLAAALKKDGHEVRVTPTSPRGEFITFKPDLVGYSVMTGSQNQFFEIDRELQKEGKHPTIWGGPHPTFFPEMETDGVIFRGECEESLPVFLKCGIMDEIGYIENIDSLEWPDRSVIPHGKVEYFITSRGCPFDCSYCVDGETLILKEDMSSVKMKDIQVGEKIIGIKQDAGLRCKVVSSTVLKKWTTKKRVFEIELDDGKKVRCSEDHRWLTHRGWKYTTGTENGENQRPFLTTNNFMRILGDLQLTPEETDDYRMGYLSGMIRGDGHLKKHGPYDLPSGNGKYYSNQFRLCLKDKEPLKRTKEFLSYFGINTYSFKFTESMNGIRKTTKKDYDKIIELISWKETDEYKRGFLAGIYDAEGGFSEQCLRISNTDQIIIEQTKSSFRKFNFNFFHEQHDNKADVIRLIGGRSEFVRFWQLTDPCTPRKRTLINAKVTHNSKIKSIKDLGYEDVLYDIETTSENFIANGMIAHNCFNQKWSELHGKKRVRFRDVADVVAEVKTVNPEFVHFQDDSFGIQGDWLANFAKIYPKIPFHCHLRPNTVTERMIRLLKESGVYSVRVGFETASQSLRNDVLNRGISFEQTDYCIELLKKYEIPFMIQNMIGIPGGKIQDDLETMKANIKWEPDYAWCSIYQPYPGTELERKCREWNLYDGKELSPSFFDQTHLNFDDRYKEQLRVLQKIFGAMVNGKYSNQLADVFTNYKLEAENRLFGFDLEG